MKHAIITGGSSGIGKATGILLAQQGVNISLIARDRSKLEIAQQEIKTFRSNSAQKVLIFIADVSIQPEIDMAIQNAMLELGTPDLLITSAGIAHPGYFTKIPLSVFEQTMAVNYFGSLYAVKAVLPKMEQVQQGHIVLISSGAGIMGIYGYTAYCPSKFALRGLAESLRGEIKPKGIKITIVYPPDTDTPQLVAENKIKPPETKRITATAKTWKAIDVAQEILQGVKKGRFIVTPGIELTLLNHLHSLISPLVNWYFDRIVKRVNHQ